MPETPRPRVLPFLPLLLLLVPAGAADATAVTWPAECVTSEVGMVALHLTADTRCAAGVPLPLVPGLEASCHERREHPENGEEPECCASGCCGDRPCCHDPSCCQDPGCCPDPAACCGDPADPSTCCYDPDCCRDPSCCGDPMCCREPTCCDDPGCCGGEPSCTARASGWNVRHRVGHEAGGLGVCVDVGQRDTSAPYARLDTTRSCSAGG